MIDFSQFGALVGFGDSNTDSGAIATFLPNLLPASQGFVAGRFSNGPNYFDQIFAEISALDPLAYAPSTFFITDPDNAAFEFGANFSVGGATAIDDLGTQIASFATNLGLQTIFDGTVPDDALFAINLTGNDIGDFLDAYPDLDIPPAALADFITDVGAAYLGGFTSLVDLGTEHILVAGAQNVGSTPSAANEAFGGDALVGIAALTDFTASVSGAILGAITTTIVADPDVTFYYFEPDISAIFEDPTSVGLDPDLLTTPFIDDLNNPALNVTLDDIDQYAYIDDVHLTQQGQAELFVQAQMAVAIGGPDAVTNNVVTGTDGNDEIDAYAGDDLVDGGLGDDVLIGGLGNDTLIGGEGSDSLLGGDGADLLMGAM